MAGVNLKIDVKGLKEFRKTLAKIESNLTGAQRVNLHRRYGIQTLNWIDENFRREGRLTGAPWKRLSPNTIAGRRKGSRKILQDVGTPGLKGSFVLKATSTDARVGTPNPVSKFHEFGTRANYPIRPKRAKVLAFPVAGGYGGPTSMVKHSFSSLTTKKTFKAGQLLGIAREVIHPGLAIRRMLPKAREIIPKLRRVVENFIKELQR